MPFQFQAAVREKVKARVALDGPSGAGKTWTALTCATALAGPNGRIAVIDTERGSARLYADTFKFDVLELPMDHRMFSPEVYVGALHAAEKAGYDVVVLDSLSHAWEGKGGALELVDQAVAAQRNGNSYVAWRKITPMHNALVDAMLQSPCHIVATMRSKMDYEQVKDEKTGKTTINKLGLAPIQRSGMEYEFTVVCDMNTDHRLIVSKTRCSLLTDRQVVKPGVEFFKELADWLAGGAEPTPKPVLTEAPKSEVKPEWTLANLIREAQKRYGVSDAEVRAALKAAGFTTFKPEQFIAALTALDTAFIDKRKPVEETEPDFLKAEVEA
jgi:hypothetical protein